MLRCGRGAESVRLLQPDLRFRLHQRGRSGCQPVDGRQAFIQSKPDGGGSPRAGRRRPLHASQREQKHGRRRGGQPDGGGGQHRPRGAAEHPQRQAVHHRGRALRRIVNQLPAGERGSAFGRKRDPAGLGPPATDRSGNQHRRLQRIGPELQRCRGPREPNAERPELMIMEQLMPVAYNPWITFASKGAPTGLNTSNYNNFSYATFGSNTQNNNSSTFLKNPSLKVMQTDIFDNGADPFEVFNALNGWSSFKVDINQGDSQYCRMITIALFNATPNFFTINIAPSKGLIAFPGCNQVTCTQGWGGAELRPYGYLTLYAQSNGSKLEDTVDIYSGATLAGSLTVQGDSFCSNGGNLSGSIKPAAGFSFTQLGVLNPRHSGDGGVWTTIYQ